MQPEVLDCFTVFAMTNRELFMERSERDAATRFARNDRRENRNLKTP